MTGSKPEVVELNEVVVYDRSGFDFDGIDAISETGSEPEVVEFNEVIN